VLIGRLDYLNTTTRPSTGKQHWHIHLVERDGGLALLLPKTSSTLAMTPYALSLAGQHSASRTGGRWANHTIIVHISREPGEADILDVFRRAQAEGR
jgi:hypothetical protein